jgi:hypothetical protein
MRAFSYFDKIVNDQNNGIPCPLCGFSQGHKVTCRTLNGTLDTPKFQPLQGADIGRGLGLQPVAHKPYTPFDKTLLWVLGVDTTKEDIR